MVVLCKIVSVLAQFFNPSDVHLRVSIDFTTEHGKELNRNYSCASFLSIDVLDIRLVAFQIYHDEHLDHRPSWLWSEGLSIRRTSLCLNSVLHLYESDKNRNQNQQFLPSDTSDNKDTEFGDIFRTIRNIQSFPEYESFDLILRWKAFTKCLLLQFDNQDTLIFYDPCLHARVFQLLVSDSFLPLVQPRHVRYPKFWNLSQVLSSPRLQQVLLHKSHVERDLRVELVRHSWG